MKGIILVFVVLFLSAAVFADGAGGNRVVLHTNHGDIVLELDPEHAPNSTASFLENVDAETYNGTLFHRVIPKFMIQGGGFSKDMKLVPTDKNIQNEADNGLENRRGTVAMARRNEPHSASIQFFINVADNEFLNHTAKTARGWGYAVFGRVVEGMDVVDQIAAVDTGRVGPMGDVPLEAVLIESAERVPAAVAE